MNYNSNIYVQHNKKINYLQKIQLTEFVTNKYL